MKLTLKQTKNKRYSEKEKMINKKMLYFLAKNEKVKQNEWEKEEEIKRKTSICLPKGHEMKWIA